MKNKTTIIVLVIVLSFITQYLIFAFLDWKSSELLNSSITIDHKYLVKTDIAEAENLQLSYNNKYLSFIIDNNLEVIDLYQNKSVFESNLLLDSLSLLNYRWLPDRNSLIFFSTESDHSRTYLYSLGFNDYSSTEYQPKLDREFNFFIANILNIEMSTYSNNLYVLFEEAKQKTRLIKMDIMKSINWLDLPEEDIYNIAVSNKLGILFLESSNNHSNRVVLLDGQERKIVSNHPDDILLGSRDNTIYIGRVNKGYLQELYSYDYYEKEGTLINVWQGKIPYEKNEQQLAVYLTETISQTHLPDGLIVFSATGNIYLQIIPIEGGFTYYWRTIQQ